MAASFSLDAVRTAFQNKEREARQKARAERPMDPYAPQPDMPPYRFVREVWTDFVVVENERAGSPGQLQKVPFTVTDKGKVSFGTPKDVRIDYVELSADAELLWESPAHKLRKVAAQMSKGDEGALDRVVALAGSERVSGYQRTSKSGKVSNVGAYTRSPGDMTNYELESEFRDLTYSPSQTGLSGSQVTSRKAMVLKEIGDRRRAGKWENDRDKSLDKPKGHESSPTPQKIGSDQPNPNRFYTGGAEAGPAMNAIRESLASGGDRKAMFEQGAPMKVGDTVQTPHGQAKVTSLNAGGTKNDPAHAVEFPDGFGTAYSSSQLKKASPEESKSQKSQGDKEQGTQTTSAAMDKLKSKGGKKSGKKVAASDWNMLVNANRTTPETRTKMAESKAAADDERTAKFKEAFPQGTEVTVGPQKHPAKVVGHSGAGVKVELESGRTVFVQPDSLKKKGKS